VNFSIYLPDRLICSERRQEGIAILDSALSEALQNTLSNYHFHIFRRKTTRCPRKSGHL